MAPLIVQLVATAVARFVVPWRDAARIGLAVMFLFTAASHFSRLKHDLAAMIPPPFTGALWLIYLTGVLEAAGAIGLLTTRWRRAAGLGLMALLVALFPANVYAAVEGVTLRGSPATPLWIRAPLQAFWFLALWWSTIARGHDAAPARPGTPTVSESARIAAPPARAYAIIADYNHAHPRILPKLFTDLSVEQGGTGAGTVIRCVMRAFGTTQTFRAAITEPDPGRVLAETILDGDGTITTFTVDPLDGGRAAYVTIATMLRPKPGFRGTLERLATPRLLRAAYREELSRLNTEAARSAAPPAQPPGQ